ncbi:MAG: hypothetical protein HY663_02180 [Chloroflexi bacterium]|nr:hypothetical protein [Chloroflexota bacterium]
MRVFKSKNQPQKSDVWVSEVHLKQADAVRIAKVKKLFRLLKEESEE